MRSIFKSVKKFYKKAIDRIFYTKTVKLSYYGKLHSLRPHFGRVKLDVDLDEMLDKFYEIGEYDPSVAEAYHTADLMLDVLSDMKAEAYGFVEPLWDDMPFRGDFVRKIRKEADKRAIARNKDPFMPYDEYEHITKNELYQDTSMDIFYYTRWKYM